MDPLGITFGILISITLIVMGSYFIWRQQQTLAAVRSDLQIPVEQRRYLYKQSWRRLFGAVLLILLGVMLLVSVFLDYDPLQTAAENAPQVDVETARQAARFLGMYWMTMLLILMVILVLAVLDFWAVARYGVQQQKQLLLEHQQMLEAELAAHRHRQAELN